MKLKSPQKNPQKQGRILGGGGSGWPEYTYTPVIIMILDSTHAAKAVETVKIVFWSLTLVISPLVLFLNFIYV